MYALSNNDVGFDFCIDHFVSAHRPDIIVIMNHESYTGILIDVVIHANEIIISKELIKNQVLIMSYSQFET